MARGRDPIQLNLFAKPPGPAPWSAEIGALAAALNPHIHLGTSSWTYTDWAGICYPMDVTEEQLLREGLGLYTRFPLFRTVGIDSSYYRPLDRDRLQEYADQLPAGFRCIEKVWDQITVPIFPVHERYGANAGRPNPSFLDAEMFFEQVHRPHLGTFDDHLACYVLEFPPLAPELRPRAQGFVDRLARFLDDAPHGPRYAVEVRNDWLLTPDYFAMLRERGVSHVYNYWSHMPTPGEQLELAEPPGEVLVMRLMIRPGTLHDERLEEFKPFNRMLDPSEEMRRDVVRLADIAQRSGRDLYVSVGNKAEGSSPLTVIELARRLVRQP